MIVISGRDLLLSQQVCFPLTLIQELMVPSEPGVGSKLTEEPDRLLLLQIAQSLIDIAEELGNALPGDKSDLALSHDRPEGVGSDRLMRSWMARHRQVRRARHKLFSSDYFHEPAWDILLELFDAWLDREPRHTMRVCAATTAPHATALRWIRRLEVDGLIVRLPHPDKRVSLLSLSRRGAELMREYLDAIHEGREPGALAERRGK